MNQCNNKQTEQVKAILPSSNEMLEIGFTNFMRVFIKYIRHSKIH